MLKKNSAGQFVIPKTKPLSPKVWITVQMPRERRNAISKIADKLGLNISRYLRKKLDDLEVAAKMGKLPADASAMVDLKCKKCGSTLEANS